MKEASTKLRDQTILMLVLTGMDTTVSVKKMAIIRHGEPLGLIIYSSLGLPFFR